MYLTGSAGPTAGNDTPERAQRGGRELSAIDCQGPRLHSAWLECSTSPRMRSPTAYQLHTVPIAYAQDNRPSLEQITAGLCTRSHDLLL